MRLLTVGSLPPEWGGPARGGAATFHAALLTQLLKGGHEVDLVGTVPPAPLARAIPVPAWVRPEEISRARFYEDLLERLRPDAVLMNHIAHTIGVTHSRLGSPVPAVGVIQSWHNITFRSGGERRHALDVTKEALRGLVAMVPVAHHSEEEGRRFGFSYPAVVETIHNPVPHPYMEADTKALSRERDGVVFIGSLIQRKNPIALVEAAALLPDLAVLLVGEGELEGELRAQIDALGGGDRMQLAMPPQGDGHVDWIRQRLLRAAVLCLPSSSEALPLVFVEALACGTPVVGFGPAVREIQDATGVEVGEPLDSDDPNEVARALEKVLSVSWDRQQLRRAALASFGLDVTTDRYVDLLARVTQ